MLFLIKPHARADALFKPLPTPVLYHDFAGINVADEEGGVPSI
jgi:hypothetical protein